MFRNYLSSIYKCEKVIIDKLDKDNIINNLCEDEMLEKFSLLNYICCLGDGLNIGFEKYLTNFYNFEHDANIHILSKEGLIHIIEDYKKSIVDYYENLKTQIEDKRKISQHINSRLNFYNEFNYKSPYNDIFLKEHEIFHLTDILNTFDFNNCYLVLTGY